MEGQMTLWEIFEEPCEPNDDVCIGCKWQDYPTRHISVEKGKTWVYGCPGTASANYPQGTPINITYQDSLITHQDSNIYCYNRESDIWNLMNLPDQIDEDIDRCIRFGTGFVNGKSKVLDIMSRDISNKEKAKLISEAYGVGGRTFEHGLFSSDGKGLRYQFDNGEDIRLTWLQAVSRIDALIRRNDY